MNRLLKQQPSRRLTCWPNIAQPALVKPTVAMRTNFSFLFAYPISLPQPERNLEENGPNEEGSKLPRI